jgi:hypothetical protein
MLLNVKLEYPLAPEVSKVTDTQRTRKQVSSCPFPLLGDLGVCNSQNRCPFLVHADSLVRNDRDVKKHQHSYLSFERAPEFVPRGLRTSGNINEALNTDNKYR